MKKQTDPSCRCPGTASVAHRCPPSTLALQPDHLCLILYLSLLRLEQPVSYAIELLLLYKYKNQSARHLVFTSRHPIGNPPLRVCNANDGQRDRTPRKQRDRHTI